MPGHGHGVDPRASRSRLTRPAYIRAQCNFILLNYAARKDGMALIREARRSADRDEGNDFVGTFGIGAGDETRKRGIC